MPVNLRGKITSTQTSKKGNKKKNDKTEAARTEFKVEGNMFMHHCEHGTDAQLAEGRKGSGVQNFVKSSLP